MTLPYSEPDDVEDELRRAMAQTAHQQRPSPVPLKEIIQEGRVRRARSRAALSAVGAVLAVGLTVPIIHLAGSTVTKNQVAAPPQSLEAAKVSEVVGSGVVDGKAWSVTLEFYPVVPKGYEVPAKAGFPVQETAGSSLLCQRIVIGGVRVDHQGGDWSGCDLVSGAHDASHLDGAGLHGVSDKGLSGTRIFVGRVSVGSHAQGVTRAEITLKDGRRLKAEVNTVPGTGYGAFAIPLGKGQTIAAVDQYNADNERLSHDTFWR
ncbi:hypothetical protein KV205_35005 [Streptomyces sp. SKN60]|uniref:hypothetical protein n=1 Tax=Streptomyces sp. SKN60 TaxID=2855506 RepID=UPI0022473FE0|nr:hypothetical protein [Streptomyces sp. SKN60]MCX2185683.1 hypothetical protein [Streptomyces sp. SKN60]